MHFYTERELCIWSSISYRVFALKIHAVASSGSNKKDFGSYNPVYSHYAIFLKNIASRGHYGEEE